MKHFYALSAILPCSLLLAVSAMDLHAAKSPFDLDISDLERKSPSKQPAPRPKNPTKKSRPETKEAEADTEGTDANISMYTVRSGDFIFKILMRNYGMTNDQAEALLPEIQRLNKLADIRNLTVGQKIAIPLGKKKKKVAEQETPEEKGPEPVQEQAEPAPIVAKTEKAERPKAAPKVEDTPSQVTSAPEAPPRAESTTAQIDLSKYPVFPAADGGKIIVDVNGSISAEDASRLMKAQPKLRIVTGKPGDAKQLLGKVLREAGFEEVNEDVSLIFGVDPQVSVDADYRVVMKDPKTGRTEAVLIDATSSTSAFSAIAEFLKNQNIKYIDLAPQREKIRVDDLTELITLPAGKRCERLDAIFDALKIPVELNKVLDLGGFKLTVDRIFTDRGKRHAVACSGTETFDYMTERLLELDGYSIIRLGEDDPEKATLEILAKLGQVPELRKHVFVLPERESVRVEISGYLIERSGRRLLIVRSAMEQGMKGLLARMKPAQ